jgi:hypothetical protein
MLSIAPVVTRYSLDTLRLFRQRAYATDGDNIQADREEAAELAATLTFQIASQLTGLLASYKDAQTQNPFKSAPVSASSRQSSRDPAA